MINASSPEEAHLSSRWRKKKEDNNGGGRQQVGDHRDTKTQVCKLKVHENDMSSSLTFKFPGLSNLWKFGFNRSGDRNVGSQNLHVKEAP